MMTNMSVYNTREQSLAECNQSHTRLVAALADKDTQAPARREVEQALTELLRDIARVFVNRVDERDLREFMHFLPSNVDKELNLKEQVACANAIDVLMAGIEKSADVDLNELMTTYGDAIKDARALMLPNEDEVIQKLQQGKANRKPWHEIMQYIGQSNIVWTARVYTEAFNNPNLPIPDVCAAFYNSTSAVKARAEQIIEASRQREC